MLFRAIAFDHEFAVEADTQVAALEKLKADPKVATWVKEAEEDGIEAIDEEIFIAATLPQQSPGVFSLEDR